MSVWFASESNSDQYSWSKALINEWIRAGQCANQPEIERHRNFVADNIDFRPAWHTMIIAA